MPKHVEICYNKNGKPGNTFCCFLFDALVLKETKPKVSTSQMMEVKGIKTFIRVFDLSAFCVGLI